MVAPSNNPTAPLPSSDNVPQDIPPAIRNLLLGNPAEDLPSKPHANRRDPLERYIDADMPKIQLHHPRSLFDHISDNTITKWWNLEGSKLLVAPFDDNIHSHELHHDIKGRILAAIHEITLSNSVSIAAHPISEEAIEKKEIPTTFIIYKLSETHRQILLQRRIWASINIAFQVAPLEPVCPDFLFNIQGLSTLEPGIIMATVKEAWNDETTNNFFQSLVEEAPPASQPALQKALSNFVQSMWVKLLKIMSKGNSLCPEFNVYAKGSFIQDTNLWPRIRRFLANRTYLNEELGLGKATIAPHFCRLCHGRDHPRGLCPFSLLDGWHDPGKPNALRPKPQRGGRSRRGPPRGP